MTVSGSNLSSVARPLIRGLVVVNRIDGSININETFAVITFGERFNNLAKE